MEVDADADPTSAAVQEFSNFLTHSLNRDYGDGVLHLTIGLICIRSVPGYDAWHKPRKPRFRRRQLIKTLDGSSRELLNAVSYDIRLTGDEYNTFVAASPGEAVKLVSAKVTQSLAYLDQLPATVRDFDRARFKRDVAHFAHLAVCRASSS